MCSCWHFPAQPYWTEIIDCCCRCRCCHRLIPYLGLTPVTPFATTASSFCGGVRSCIDIRHMHALLFHVIQFIHHFCIRREEKKMCALHMTNTSAYMSNDTSESAGRWSMDCGTLGTQSPTKRTKEFHKIYATKKHTIFLLRRFLRPPNL